MSASNRLRANLMLITTALIWGVAFVAQSVGMDYIGPFTFNCVRSLLGGLVLLPCIFLLDRLDGGKTAVQKKWPVLGGVCCGVVLAVASSLQQIGIAHTSVGKAGFITALYIVFVPLLGLLGGKRVGGRIWAAVALAVAGMYLLCITESFTIGHGDLLVLLCAFCFSIHILVIDHFSPNVDGVRMSCIQFFTAGILCGVPMLLFESPNLTDICAAWAPVAYAGIMSCGVAYTLQVVAQKHTDPTVASLLLSLESVISVLAGWVLLGQALSPRELTGCALSFCAIILAQLPDRASRA